MEWPPLEHHQMCAPRMNTRGPFNKLLGYDSASSREDLSMSYIFLNYDFFLYIHNQWFFFYIFLKFFVIFIFMVIVLIQFCVILVRNGIFSRKKWSSNLVIRFYYVIDIMYIYFFKNFDKILTHFGDATWQWSDLPLNIIKCMPHGRTQVRVSVTWKIKMFCAHKLLSALSSVVYSISRSFGKRPRIRGLFCMWGCA